MNRITPKVALTATVALAVAGVAIGVESATSASPATKQLGAAQPVTPNRPPAIPDRSAAARTTTPIKHVVVIYDENVSFDHYFGTYPNTRNPAGEPKFRAKADTPSVNGLNSTLLRHNPNAYNPTRLRRSQAVTCDQDHSYGPEQQAADHGLMDKFVEYTASGDCSASYTGEYYRKGLVMDYYDGNTVTGLWNYAQNFALNDNSYGTQYGPSTPGALDLISGNTHGATASGTASGVVNGTDIADYDSTLDACGKGTTMQMSGRNVGNLLNAKQITWGWFQGGFAPSARDTSGKPVCGTSHANISGSAPADYSAHHNPFEYYKSTANPNHLPPSSVSNVGRTDKANHEYDLSNFWDAADAGLLPSVSFLKAAEYQDGHAGYSDPLDEQHFLVSTINHLQLLPQWKNTAVVIAYDDSDGWYDHQMGPIVRHSNDAANDSLSGPGSCGTPAKNQQLDRCGYGPRLPLLVISPYARKNFVDSSLTDQTSILRFIEDNWSLGRIGNQSADAIAGPMTGMFNFSAKPDTKPYLLDPGTGQPTHYSGNMMRYQK